uniref:Uncharacterized protein n=1 Tax=Fagus sylvatica TaxID=28930 RepID=A0A2N9EV82_FAGSY
MAEDCATRFDMHLQSKSQAVEACGSQETPHICWGLHNKASQSCHQGLGVCVERSWEAISKGERHAPGPASAMTSKGSRSMSDLRTMGSTEATMVSTEALPN